MDERKNVKQREAIVPKARPDEFDYAKLSAQFSAEEQNAAAWLAIVLLLAENRAMCDSIRKLLVEKEVCTSEEAIDAIKSELEQPNLGNWYGFMNQLYAFRVAETLDIQRQKNEGTIPPEDAPLGDLKDVAGGKPIPTGAPPKEDIIAATTIVQTAPVEADTDGEQE